MVILLVGPSHAGKTSLSKKLTKRDPVKYVHHDLDQVIKSKSLIDAEKIIVELECDHKVHLLDFGAGFQNRTDSYVFFQKYCSKMITIIQDENVLFLHHKQGDPRLNRRDFHNREFSVQRRNIYEVSFSCIRNNIDNQRQTLKILENSINEILNRHY